MININLTCYAKKILCIGFFFGTVSLSRPRSEKIMLKCIFDSVDLNVTLSRTLFLHSRLNTSLFISQHIHFCVTLILFVISKIYTVHFGSLIFDKRLMSAYVCVSFCSMTCEHDVHGEINHVETLITMIIVKTYIDIFFQL